MTNIELRELIDRTMRYRSDNLRATTVGFALFGELTDALQSYAARVEELEEIIERLRKRDQEVYDDDSLPPGVRNYCRRSAEIADGLLKQLPGLDASHDPTHQ